MATMNQTFHIAELARNAREAVEEQRNTAFYLKERADVIMRDERIPAADRFEKAAELMEAVERAKRNTFVIMEAFDAMTGVPYHKAIFHRFEDRRDD